MLANLFVKKYLSSTLYFNKSITVFRNRSKTKTAKAQSKKIIKY